MTAIDGPPRRWWVAVLAGVLTTAGCHRDHDPAPGGPGPPPHDPALARQALGDALDAWKQGQIPALARRPHPIRFVDEDHATGFRLTDYHVAADVREIALHRSVSVALTLRDSQGRTVQRQAAYQVSTTPGLAVLRSE